MPDRHVSVSVPPTWAARSDPEHGIVVAARARELPPGAFPPELVVRSVPVETDLPTWRAEALTAMAGQLAEFDLEDEDLFSLGDHDVLYRRFVHRVAARDVVGEQWSWVIDGVGVTLTCSVSREDYADWCDVFEEVAATVELRPVSAA